MAKYIIKWNKKHCKFCQLCVNFCPKKNLEIRSKEIIDKGLCINCGLCEKYCPDLAIEVI